MRAKVVVIGSLNMDLVTHAERLPRAGETLMGDDFATHAGGKGANQAVAAARLGASVAMIGCVGEDGYGEDLRQALIAEGIDCQGVEKVAGARSGVALIVVDGDSQNAIVVVSGANARLDVAALQRFDALLQDASVVVCQLETPLPTIGHALRRAHELGKTVILNPAPAEAPLPSDWYAAIDYLIPNEAEAQALSGVPVYCPASAEQAAQRLRELGAHKVIVTLGSQGVRVVDEQRSQHSQAFAVEAVDSTAAGDTFVGAFAAALARGDSQQDAVRFAQRAAALSVSRNGAQPSIPTLAEVEAAIHG